MVYLLIFLLANASAAGSSVTVVQFHNWKTCAAAAKIVSRVDIPPLGKALKKEEWENKPDVVAICANSGGANAHEGRAKAWN